MTILHAHDNAFRVAMSDLRVAKSLLEQHLPVELHSRFDWQTFQVRKESYVDQRLHKQTVDMLYRVELQQTPQSAYVYILTEAQSTPDKLMPWRMLSYTHGIIAQHMKETTTGQLPLVIPLVIYHGKQPYCYPVNIFELYGEEKALAEAHMFTHFRLVDLSQIPDEEIVRQQYASLLQIVMKHIYARDFMQAVKTTLREILQALAHENEYIANMLYYAMQKANIQNEEAFFDLIESSLPEPTKEDVMTLAELWTERGRKQGYEKALQEAHTLAEKLAEKGRKQGYEEGLQEARTLAEKLAEKGRKQGYEEALQEARTLAEKWAEKGRKQGYEEGLQEAHTLAEKLAEKGRKQGYEEALQEARTLAEKLAEEGRKQGYEAGILSVALNLLAKGMSLSEVQLLTKLPTDKLEALQKNLCI